MSQIIKMKISTHQNLNSFNFSSSTLPILKLPSKIQIKSLQFSNDGKEGAIFVQLSTGSFVLKSSLTIPKQIFYNRFASEMGLRVPQIKFFSITDVAYQKLFEAICEYCQAKDQCLFYRLKSTFNNLFYGVIQYCPSISLESMGSKNTQRLFKIPLKLYEIGLCLGFDLVINNNDRFECLWSGDANLSNVLISSNKKQTLIKKDNFQTIDQSIVEFIFIDNCGNMCDPGKQISGPIQTYLNQVKQLLQHILFFLKNPTNLDGYEKLMSNKGITKFLNNLNLLLGRMLNRAQLKQILIGIKDSFQRFLHLKKEGVISLMIKKVRESSKGNDFASAAWARETQKISLVYCQRLFQIVGPVFEKNEKKDLGIGEPIKFKEKNILLDQI